MTKKIVIVGAGECGALSALRLREFGFDGSITVVGEERREPYERPPLSKRFLTDATLVDPVGLPASNGHAITTTTGTQVVSVEPLQQRIVLANGEHLPYDRLLLATGSRPRPVPIPGGELALLLRTFDDALALRRHLVPRARVGIIGGGFIGLEVAAAASELGCTVTVFELAGHLLSRAVPVPISNVITERHRRAGVDIRCSTSVQRVDRCDTGLVVSTGTDQHEFDVVVGGIGSIPNIELAVTAGLTINNGVAVDGFLRTSAEAIFAAGDCCSFPHPLFGDRRLRLEAWRNAHDQARFVAQSILGSEQDYRNVPWFWSDQFDLGIQIAGVAEAATNTIVRHKADGGFVIFGVDAEGRLVSAAGVGPGASIAREIRPAELLIANSATADLDVLADPLVNLKTLLRGVRVQS